MAKAKLDTYFRQWSEHTEAHTYKKDKNFKELLCRKYNSTMQQAWNYWTQGLGHHKKKEMNIQNDIMMESGEQLQKKNIEIKSCGTVRVFRDLPLGSVKKT